MIHQTRQIVHFTGGDYGEWRVQLMNTIIGEAIAPVSHLHIRQTDASELFSHEQPQKPREIWTLNGFSSNLRYTEENERKALAQTQAVLGRTEATCATLIPIRKSDSWWNLAQDERRRIFETSSHHIRIGRNYLPAIARKLYHARDIGEPFDFLTWFEYAPDDEKAFSQLLQRLRATEEWSFVEREVEIRLIKT
jgi:hypothetical protein